MGLGSYEIIVPIGSGRIGEEREVHDTRLDSEVAIKVPRPSSADDFSAKLAR